MKEAQSPGKFLAAVSGGADSMAMLAALCAVTQKENIFCLHVDHGLRPAEESSGDAEFVRDFCREAGINCDVVSIPPGKIALFARRRGIGIEAAARFFRRRALFRQAARLGENVVILTAHTKDAIFPGGIETTSQFIPASRQKSRTNSASPELSSAGRSP